MKKVILVLLLINLPLLAQWIQIGQSLNSEISSLAKVNNTLFAGTKSKGIFSTSDEANWTEKNSGITNLKINAIAANNGTIAAGSDGSGVFFSDNLGDSWVSKSNGLTIPFVALPYVYSLMFSGNNIIAGGLGIFTTTDNAANWTRVLASSMGSRGLYKSANYLYCGVGPTIYRSTDNGLVWNSIVTANTTIKDFYTMPALSGGDIIYVATLDGFYISSDDGKSWKTSNSGLLYQNMNSLVGTGQNLFTATENGGVFYSIDGGTNWNDGNIGLPANVSGRTLLINNGFIYVGLNDGTVWKRSLSDFGITSINETDKIPFDFTLSQNYPNPFNPSTTISFMIPKSEFVSLKVYDILGNEIATLVNEQLSAGTYNYQFSINNNELSSGIYFYKLQAGNNIQTKKMILMK